MRKTILITGSTDGIGLEAARILARQGQRVLLHGRSETKLKEAARIVSPSATYLADLSRMDEVEAFASAVAKEHKELHALVNNAGVYATPDVLTQDGIDVRFAVNTIAPYLLTKRLLPLLRSEGRVVNLASAAQSPVSLKALSGQSETMSDDVAYAQSKLALTMWTRSLALTLNGESPSFIALNPGSLLETKMVKEAYGIVGKDMQIGAEIVARAAVEDRFGATSGQYFDNDIGDFASPHPDALQPEKIHEIVEVIETFLGSLPGEPCVVLEKSDNWRSE